MQASTIRTVTWLVVALSVALTAACTGQDDPIDERIEESLEPDPLPGTSTKGYGEITDLEIETQVDRELFLDPAVDGTGIEVTSSYGIVTLSGTVPYILARERAVDQAEAVRGVRAVVNGIQVVPRGRPDEDIAEDIGDSLESDRVIEADEVEYDVEGGEVTLHGLVGSWAEHDAAEDLVKQVPGVKGVRNLTLVEPGEAEARGEGEILEEVERRIAMDPYLDSSIVDVVVDGSIVHLMGHVGSMAERRRVVDHALVRGVSYVDTTGLNVSDWINDSLERDHIVPEPSDEEIRETVLFFIAEDPWIDGDEIDVSVKDGHVKLEGTTDDLESSRLAESHAHDILGVWTVDNEIEVDPPLRIDDLEVEKDIIERLAASPLLADEAIAVKVEDGRATLGGTVEKAFTRWVALDIASGVPGVLVVEDAMVVGPEWAMREDEAIREDVENLYLASTHVDEDAIDVAVSEGEVTLTGEANGWHAIEQAIDLAFQAGAKSVTTEVTVDDTSDSSTYLWSEWQPY